MNIVTSLKSLVSNFPNLFKEGMSQEEFDGAVSSLITKEDIQTVVNEQLSKQSSFDATELISRISILEGQLDVKNEKSLAFAVKCLSSDVVKFDNDLTDMSAKLAELDASEIEKDLIEDEGNPFMMQVESKSKTSNGITVVKIEKDSILAAKN